MYDFFFHAISRLLYIILSPLGISKNIVSLNLYMVTNLFGSI